MPAASPTEPPGKRRALPGDSELVSEHLITGDPDEPDRQSGAANMGKHGEAGPTKRASYVRSL